MTNRIKAVALAIKGLALDYVAYWNEASKETGPDTVSAKRAVFIHGSALAGLAVMLVLYKAGWKFTTESLGAFKAFLLAACGGYLGGKVIDAVSTSDGKGGGNDTQGVGK